jgi:hypothetical protein
MSTDRPLVSELGVQQGGSALSTGTGRHGRRGHDEGQLCQSFVKAVLFVICLRALPSLSGQICKSVSSNKNITDVGANPLEFRTKHQEKKSDTRYEASYMYCIYYRNTWYMAVMYVAILVVKT